MAKKVTEAECKTKGWFWIADTQTCEKPRGIGEIKMTLTRGPGCDGPTHRAGIPVPKNLSSSVKNALLNASRKR